MFGVWGTKIEGTRVYGGGATLERHLSRVWATTEAPCVGLEQKGLSAWVEGHYESGALLFSVRMTTMEAHLCLGWWGWDRGAPSHWFQATDWVEIGRNSFSVGPLFFSFLSFKQLVFVSVLLGALRHHVGHTAGDMWSPQG